MPSEMPNFLTRLQVQQEVLKQLLDASQTSSIKQPQNGSDVLLQDQLAEVEAENESLTSAFGKASIGLLQAQAAAAELDSQVAQLERENAALQRLLLEAAPQSGSLQSVFGGLLSSSASEAGQAVDAAGVGWATSASTLAARAWRLARSCAQPVAAASIAAVYVLLAARVYHAAIVPGAHTDPLASVTSSSSSPSVAAAYLQQVVDAVGLRIATAGTGDNAYDYRTRLGSLVASAVSMLTHAILGAMKCIASRGVDAPSVAPMLGTLSLMYLAWLPLARRKAASTVDVARIAATTSTIATIMFALLTSCALVRPATTSTTSLGLAFPMACAAHPTSLSTALAIAAAAAWTSGFSPQQHTPGSSVTDLSPLRVGDSGASLPPLLATLINAAATAASGVASMRFLTDVAAAGGVPRQQRQENDHAQLHSAVPIVLLVYWCWSLASQWLHARAGVAHAQQLRRRLAVVQSSSHSSTTASSRQNDDGDAGSVGRYQRAHQTLLATEAVNRSAAHNVVATIVAAAVVTFALDVVLRRPMDVGHTSLLYPLQQMPPLDCWLAGVTVARIAITRA